MSFSKNLRNEIFYNGFKIKEFAEKIDIPYASLLSYINQKESLPRVDIAVKIAKGLNVSVEFLVTGEEIEKRVIHRPISNSFSEISALPPELRIPLQEFIHNLYRSKI